jgi:hypothetical protein
MYAFEQSASGVGEAQGHTQSMVILYESYPFQLFSPGMIIPGFIQGCTMHRSQIQIMVAPFKVAII